MAGSVERTVDSTGPTMTDDTDSQCGRIVETERFERWVGSADDPIASRGNRKPTVAIVGPEVQRESGR